MASGMPQDMDKRGGASGGGYRDKLQRAMPPNRPGQFAPVAGPHSTPQMMHSKLGQAFVWLSTVGLPLPRLFEDKLHELEVVPPGCFMNWNVHCENAMMVSQETALAELQQ